MTFEQHKTKELKEVLDHNPDWSKNTKIDFTVAVYAWYNAALMQLQERVNSLEKQLEEQKNLDLLTVLKSINQWLSK